MLSLSRGLSFLGLEHSGIAFVRFIFASSLQTALGLLFLWSTASQVRTGTCRNSREVGDTSFRTDAKCRLESSVYHLSFKVFGAVDAAHSKPGQEG